MRKVIAIDFDGTLCENAWPEIGAPKRDVINRALAEQEAGAALILWTCREGDLLEEAVFACRTWGLYFDAVNENLPERTAEYGNDCRKIGADEYWDDRAVPLRHALWEDEWGGRYANPRYRCSACKAKALFHFEWDGLGHEQAVQDLSDHCHKCGAKMCKEADHE